MWWFEEHVRYLFERVRLAVMRFNGKRNWKRSPGKHDASRQYALFSVPWKKGLVMEQLINFIEPIVSGFRIKLMRSDARIFRFI